MLQSLLKYTLLVLTLSQMTNLSAAPVTSQYQGLAVNANLELGDSDKPIFLILHGTLAWHGMELPKALQTVLADEGYPSLAISLSYGVDNRSGFYNCEQGLSSGQGAAISEIDHWVDYLHQQGYKNVAVIAHSRGGAQMADYSLQHSDKITQLHLIAPMHWNMENSRQRYDAEHSKSLAQVLSNIEQNPQQPLLQQDVLSCKNTTVSAAAFRSYYSPIPEKNTPALLSSINVKTSVYLGTNDPLTLGFMAQQALFAANPLIDLVMIEDADHFFRDLYADEIIEDILERLE
ncbi:MAG: alpha/beta hydrolase [Pseudomonadales bacterium]|nr:alpha/beta hydrolase [Pseudomonadales bacterium]